MFFSLAILGCAKGTSGQNPVQPPVQVVDDPLTEQNRFAEIINAYHIQRNIFFLAKVNFGIPGGDNWLADSNGHLFIYVISDNKVSRNYYLGPNYVLNEYSQYDIMQDIPGMRINNGTSAYGDYNNDGVAEVFKYVFDGHRTFIIIYGYDSNTDQFVNFSGTPAIPFGVIDFEKGPAPVQFMTYKGMEGFKVYVLSSVIATGPNEPYRGLSPYNNKWYFFAWDAEKRQYVEHGEVVE